VTFRQRALFAAVLLCTLAALAWLGLHWRREQEARRWDGLVPGAAPLCIEASKLFCERLQSCGGLDRAQFSDCVEHHVRDCQEDIGWRIQSGVRILQPEARDECLEAVGEASCNAVAFVLGDDEQDIFESTTECERDEMLVPDGGIGRACSLSSDCIGATCTRGKGGLARCTAWGRLGEPCGPFLPECDPGAGYCGAADGGAQCLPLESDGAPCTNLRECSGGVCRGFEPGSPARSCARGAGGPCADGSDCIRSEFCLRDAGSGRCAPRASNGAACVFVELEQVCQEPEASCVRGRCRVRAMSLGQGEPCRDFTDCLPGLYCQWDVASGKSGRCVPQGELGDACRAGDFGSCRLGARCLDGACRKASSQGQPCSGPFACQTELSCALPAGDAGDARCLPLAAPGDGCGPTHACRHGFTCRATPWGGTCVALGADAGA
jgi:hypothetical protein